MANRTVRVERALEALCTLQVGDPGAREHVRTVSSFVAANVDDDVLWLLRRLDALDVDGLQADAEIERAREATDSERRKAFARLRSVLEAPRVNVLRHLATAPGDLRFVVDLRDALLTALAHRPDAADLAGLDDDLRAFLAARIEVGSLELRRLTWRDSAALLEKLAKLEAVHAVRGWFDLKDRLDDDRRCYAFFHPALPDTPLVFTEVALTNDTPASIRAILNKDAARVDPAVARAATFYSISNCETGLTGIPFGNALIKRAVETLRAELPQLRVFATLSPMPGFAAWVRSLGERLDANVREQLSAAGWQRSTTAVAALREPLLQLAARYLLEAKRRDGAPADAVARFHLGNGAIVDRVDFLADPTQRGLAQAFGMMVNYRYAADRIAANQLAYAHTFAIDASAGVKALCAAEPTIIGERPAAPRRQALTASLARFAARARGLFTRRSARA